MINYVYIYNSRLLLSSNIFLDTLQSLCSLLLLILLLLERILFGCAVGASKTIPQRNVLPIVIVEVQMMHRMARRTIDDFGSRQILRII